MDNYIQSQLKKAEELCNQHKFRKAETLAMDIVTRDANVSEAWRLLATIDWFGNNNIDKAEDELIESLRLDPKNTASLLLMGNLLVLKRNDLKSAKTYYDKILEYHPDDAIAINNIGGIYMKNHKYEQAIDCFQKAQDADPTFPNSYYAMALCFKAQARNMTAFDVCVDGMLKCKDRPENPNVKSEIARLMMQQADILYGMSDFTYTYETFRQTIAEYGGHPVKLIKDESLTVTAQTVYGLWHNSNENVIRYNPQKHAGPHAILHEFMHLQMLIAASKAGCGKIITHTKENYNNFDKAFGKEFRQMHGSLNEEGLSAIEAKVYNGLMTQVTSYPLDLFVEDLLYEYPGERYVQVLALDLMDKEYIQQANNKDIMSAFPKRIAEINKELNIVSSMHYRQLYGIDNISKYHPTEEEVNEAQSLYEAYRNCKETYKAGDEYQLLDFFAKELGVSEFFDIVDEPKEG